MLSRDEELVVQAAVRWHPGCAGGRAWVQWGINAISAYRDPKASLLRALVERWAQRLWESKHLQETVLLASRSPAGEELLRCAIHFIGHQRHRPVQLSEIVGDENQMELRLSDASMWARDVAVLIEAVYELPPDIVTFVRRAAAAHGWQLPEHLDIQRPEHLVAAAEARLGLENAIETGAWPLVPGSSLPTSQARVAAETLLRAARVPNARAGRAAAFKGLANDFNHSALDGLELELGEVHILHIPSPDSPLRPQVRDRMIGIVDAYVTRGEKSRQVPRAAHILARIGDDVAVQKMVHWMHEHPKRASSLFSEHFWDSLPYAIDLDGRRQEVVLGCFIPLVRSTPPDSPERREHIEVFRPIGGTCARCGERLVALFDVLVNPEVHRGLPSAHRVCIPVCTSCAEAGGYRSCLHTEHQETSDLDAWPLTELGEHGPGFAARHFRPRSPDVPHELTPAGSFVGGEPRWEQEPEWPKCDDCRRRMIFIGQVEVGPTYYGFFCPECLASDVRTQYD